MPASPPPFPIKTAPLPPSTTTPLVSPTRASARPPQIPSPVEAGPSVPRSARAELTPAEAYANAHYPRQSREREKTAVLGHHVPGTTVSKPIFDWITRKLGGGGRRATVTDFGPSRSENTGVRYPSLPRHEHRHTARRVAPPPPPTELSTFTRQTSNSLSRAESQSLRSYSFSPVSERRKEANNPYPSIPVPLLQGHHREPSTNDGSYLSRSLTPSLRSEASLTSSFPQRVSLLDDGSSSFRLAGRVADEDASVRPLPPSHRASPTPSVSRSASTSLLSPHPSARPISPSLKTRDTGSIGGDRSFVSSEPEEGRQSRRDSSRPDSTSRRDSASTKPTTIVSIDGPLPTTHIAQTYSSYQVPPSPLRGSLSRDQDAPAPGPTPIAPVTPVTPTLSLTQAPRHSHPHPRDNPRPSSPPDDNASTLTLASSTFAAPPGGSWTPSVPSLYQRPASIHQISAANTPNPYLPPFAGTSPISTPLNGPSTAAYRPPSLATSPSVTWAPGPDRNSLVDYSASLHPTMGTSFRTGGWAGERGVADGDASVRAVRRKGSCDSNQSGWSWRGVSGTPGGHISPPPLLQNHSSQTGAGVSSSGAGIDNTPRLSQLAPPFDLTVPIDLTDTGEEEAGPRDVRELRIDTGIAA